MLPILATVVLERLAQHPSLSSNLTIAHIQRFIHLAHRLWPDITGAINHLAPAPVILPLSIVSFLGSVLDLDNNVIQLCWIAFGDLVPGHSEEESLDDMFRIHGHEHSLGAEAIYPPMQMCPNPQCCHVRLTEESKVEGRLYTLKRGVLPIYSASTYCRNCHTRFYHNYSVADASQPDARRSYYAGIMPEFIHVTETAYVERALCLYFEAEMSFTHASSENIARVYNLALGNAHLDLPNPSRLNREIDGELILDAFFLHSLLRDKHGRRETLTLPHHGLQRHRYLAALSDRNYRMAGTGQEMWAHTCKKCAHIYRGEDGRTYRVTAGVTDGVTLGHPCCSILDCRIPLISQQDRYCPQHSRYNLRCCIIDCLAMAEPGFKTCSEATHRNFQTSREIRGSAMFQLRGRLQRSGVSELLSAGDNLAAPCAPHQSEPDVSNSSVKGRLTRRWTHNEQLFVRCCGIILSRATMYGSEGITGVKDFLKATFPLEFPGVLPSYIFYDDNCHLWKHLVASGDTYFAKVGLPVDVFHFKSKHRETDTFCQTHCNPARFCELIGANNTWIFNSSVAEQTNAWFGLFQPIVREMPEPKYNFFLDEMIAIRNRFISKTLTSQGQRPYILPEAFIRGEEL